jgi:hemoglobin
MHSEAAADRSEPDGRSDLDSPDAIAELVRRFYREVAQDDLLGPVFNDVAAVDWAEHLPKLTAFWCRALLDQPGYSGNPFQKHAAVNDRSPFTAAHFERWLALFDDALDGWAGPAVERARALAANVARVHGQRLVGGPPALVVTGTLAGPAAGGAPTGGGAGS